VPLCSPHHHSKNLKGKSLREGGIKTIDRKLHWKIGLPIFPTFIPHGRGGWRRETCGEVEKLTGLKSEIVGRKQRINENILQRLKRTKRGLESKTAV